MLRACISKGNIMLLRLCGWGLIVAGVSTAGLLAARPDDNRTGATATATGSAASALDTASTNRAEADQPAAAQTAKGPVNTSGLLNDLASKYLPSHLPADSLVWRTVPLSVLLEANRMAGLFGKPRAAPLPAELASAQISRQFLENYFRRAVERDSIVDDQVLGLKIAGRSHLTGQVHLLWHSADQAPGFDLIFTGVCHSQTDGLHEVVTLHNQAETHFEARKEFIWTETGLETSPAVAQAETHSKTVNIDSSLPGFVGRIATEIAHDRANQRRAEADAISGQHASQRIAGGFDQRVDHQLAILRLVSHHLPVGGLLRQATRFEVASTGESLHLAVYRRDVAGNEQTVGVLPEHCDAAIRLHRGVFQQALADRMGLAVLGGLVLHFLTTESQQVAQAAAADNTSPQPKAYWQMARSVDGQWLLVEHYSPEPASQPSLPEALRPTPATPVSQERPVVGN